MKFYLVIDNQRPSRNLVIHAQNKSAAMDKGASVLKTTNIGTKQLKTGICEKCAK